MWLENEKKKSKKQKANVKMIGYFVNGLETVSQITGVWIRVEDNAKAGRCFEKMQFIGAGAKVAKAIGFFQSKTLW